MQKSSHLIGLLGGTFDPIHDGHLRTAMECLHAFKLDHVRFIPCNQPVHRSEPTASGEQRLAMVKLATQSEPKFIVDEVEFHYPGPSYMHTTLTHLRKTCEPNTYFCLILGMDAFSQLHTWHRFEELLTLTHIIVATRPNQPYPTHPTLIHLLETQQIQQAEELTRQPTGLLAVLPVTPLDISASDIRTQYPLGLSARYLCPDNVVNYIDKNGLYRV